MGKNTASKARPTATLNSPAAAFFTPAKSQAQMLQTESPQGKMAPASESSQESVGSMGREEFRLELTEGLDKLEVKLVKKIASLIAPLIAQMQELQSNIMQTAQTAGAAMELGLATQEATRALQKQSDWAAEKILSLENHLKIIILN